MKPLIGGLNPTDVFRETLQAGTGTCKHQEQSSSPRTYVEESRYDSNVLGIPRGHWPVSLAIGGVPGHSERSCLKKQDGRLPRNNTGD